MPNEIKKAPPAKHVYTQEELDKLIKAAEDPAVQAIVHNLAVKVFHTATEAENPATPVQSTSKSRSPSRNNTSSGG